MSECSLVSEFFAIIIIFIIALFFYDAKTPQAAALRRKIYAASFILCTLTTVLGIICIRLDGRLDVFSSNDFLFLRTMYFVTLWGMIAALAHYLILRLHEFINNSKKSNISHIICYSIFACFLCLLLYNLQSGILFYIDENGVYRYGLFKNFTYLMPLSEIALVLLAYYVNRDSLNSTTQKMLFVIGPVAVALLLLQYLNPEHHLHGLICATVNLVVFIAYNGGRSDQDSFTGLPNRQYFFTEIKQRTRRKESFQFIMIKLRKLSKINAIYGENTSNSLILQTSRLIQNIAEDAKTFRYADDEFIIMFSGIEPEITAERIENIKRIIDRDWRVRGETIPIRFSVIEFINAEKNWTADDIQGYLSEVIMETEKSEEGVFRFEEDFLWRRQRREYVVELLKDALREGRLKVWYQPVYYHDSGKFLSAEALIRMYDRSGKIIPPDEFIPIAEESTLIDDITVFVVENVCRLLASGDVPEMEKVCVNVPVRQILDEDFFSRLKTIMNAYGIEKDRIRYEITERDMEEKGESAGEAMEKSAQSGYRFMLDDFGIGYSNFSRVLDMTLDGIKLDRSLVLQMNKEERHHKLIKEYLVPIMHQVGHFIIAEGVETEEMLHRVLDCNISRIQGYYFAKPMPEDELIRWYGGIA